MKEEGKGKGREKEGKDTGRGDEGVRNKKERSKKRES
jgi:hypothetical protein